MKRKAPAHPTKDVKKAKGQSRQSSTVASKSEKGLSERRLKQYSSAKSGKLSLSVGITGARAGDMLRGVEGASNGDVANVVLRIVSGVVAAPSIIRRSVEAEVGREALVDSVSKHFGISKAAAGLRYDDFPQTEAPNHQPLGSGCVHGVEEDCTCPPAATFVVVSQGVWQGFAEQHGNGAELQAMVEEHRAVCWRDVLKLMYTPGLPEGKKLILRPRLFELVAGPEQILSEVKNEEVLDVLDAFPGDRAGALTLRLSGMLVRVPASAQAFHLEPEAVREAVEGLISTSEEQILACLAPLRKLSLGALKSCLQKVIRFHAKDVSLGQNSVPVPAPVVAAASCGLLFAAKGGFSPELQLFTRGCTAALKRLAVILVEDAWVEDPQAPAQLASLLALGLVTQQMSYEPPRHVVVSAMRLAAKAASSGSVIAWRTPSKSASASKVKVKVSEPQSRFFQSSARLLRVLRSFPGDMEMLDRAAKAATLGALELQRAAERPEVMPLCHLVDQHAFRGVGHVLGAGSGATFAERFRVLFEKCTGCNPRLSSLADFETRPEVRVARFAQRCCLHMALSKARSAIPSASEGVSVSLELDAGVLAAAVGPVPVQAGRKRKRELLVLLGLRCPEDEVVMQKPARATRDLFGELTEQERAEAISVARSQRQKAQSPLLPGTQHAQFRDTWMLDGRKWEDLVKEGLKVTVPSAPAPGWCNESTDWERLLEDDAAFEEALQSAGAGMTPDARKWTLRLTSALPHAVCLRGVSLLRQQYTSIQLPTPSLQGGLVSDQLAAYDGDWLVYRLLVLVSQLVPALRPTAPPNFQVGNPVLLRVLEKWMMEGIQLVGTARPSGPSCSSASGAEWAELRRHLEASAKLMEHQREAICRMVERDEHLKCGGHFLIMDTGHGKTITALLYAFRWLESSGQNVRRIMWVTPAGTVENLVKQLRTTWRCPTHVVPRISSAKKPKTGEGADLALKDFMVNVIHADHLRTAIDKGLAAEATSSFFVFDEVDEMYAPTLRTSAARRLCQLCPKFVAQTATPMRKNESQLIAWLADTCAFPVNKKNWLVAASGMVSMQLELGIKAREEEVLVPMAEEVRDHCRKLLKSRTACWLEMACLVQQHTDPAMVRQAVKAAQEDRVKHADGGVLLVADSRQHAEKLIKLCSAHLPTGDFASLESSDAKRFAIVVVTKDKDRGYNSARRLGVMVTGAYAGNAASRHQIRGRLRRLGQKRQEVRFLTVCMENSILHLLHKRHSAVDTMNISLEQLGQKFGAEVVRGLG
eukprot:CAMPEP_0181435760 /NCGR_PEP_ID=MMETSP1110-20121109/20500_1 /TAXON_ID=174948 /ORGANISM="Symbiodinium sp., Strain CCMP421" /LENGTH=1270 /DNA_ID=CAMNT_0023559307 /DNA_START=15 /DNA_END=3827 /DNA_ORIENTATION=-